EREQRGGQPIAQRREPGAGLLELGPRQPRRRAEADDAGDVLRPRPALALLVTSLPARLERRAPSQENRARALGPWILCAEIVSASTPSAPTSIAILPAACTASVWTSAPRS